MDRPHITPPPTEDHWFQYASKLFARTSTQDTVAHAILAAQETTTEHPMLLRGEAAILAMRTLLKDLHEFAHSVSALDDLIVEIDAMYQEVHQG